MKYFTRELWKEINSENGKKADEEWRANGDKYQKYIESLTDRADIQDLENTFVEYHGFHDWDVETMTVNPMERTVVISLHDDSRVVLRFSGVDKVNFAINELYNKPVCMEWGYFELEAFDRGRIGLSVVFDWENEMEIVFEKAEIEEEQTA